MSLLMLDTSIASGIGVADELIAAHALSLGAVVVTDTVRRFGRMAGLEVQNWLR